MSPLWGVLERQRSGGVDRSVVAGRGRDEQGTFRAVRPPVRCCCGGYLTSSKTHGSLNIAGEPECHCGLQSVTLDQYSLISYNIVRSSGQDVSDWGSGGRGGWELCALSL